MVRATDKVFTWKEAFEDSHEAAVSGHPGAQNFVGYCYDMGRGVRKDGRMARRWYERAARNGNIHAIFNLAVINDKGLGIRRNPSRAVRLYRQAALRGDLQSQTNLAVMLLDGDGAKRDTAAGIQWMRRAARRGDSKAQYNLGLAYEAGDEGVRRSIRYAKKWFSKAADSGHAKARRLLKSLRKKSA